MFIRSSRLRVLKGKKKKGRRNNHLVTVEDIEEEVFQKIPHQEDNVKQQLKRQIEESTIQAEKKTAKDRMNYIAVKQDAFINVNSFLGGLLLFGLTGKSSPHNPPDKTVLELRLLCFFIFLGSLMSNLMFLLFVKFHNWKKYQPYQEALAEIKSKAELIWWDHSKHDDGDQEWNQYQENKSLKNIKNVIYEAEYTNTNTSFLEWTREVLDSAARQESKDRESLRRWSIFIPFSLTFFGMVMLCLVVFMGAHVQLHTGRDPPQGGMHLWIYIVAPLSLFLPFLSTLRLIVYYTGRLHDINMFQS